MALSPAAPANVPAWLSAHSPPPPRPRKQSRGHVPAALLPPILGLYDAEFTTAPGGVAVPQRMQDALANLHPTLDLTAALPGGPRLCGGRAAFRLAAFITAPGRHFVAHCEVEGVWWRFDDTAVTRLGGFAEARAFALKHKQSEALVGLFFEAAPLAVEDARRAKVGGFMLAGLRLQPRGSLCRGSTSHVAPRRARALRASRGAKLAGA